MPPRLPAPPSPVRRLLAASLLAALAALGAHARAQVYTPPAPSGGGSQPPAGGETTVIDSGRGAPAQPQQQMLGTDLPFLDPTTDVFTFDGKSFHIADNRLFRARFEKYLSAEPATSEEDLAYRETVRSILDTLSPHNRESDKFAKAVANLQYAANFPQDARLSESLANAIYRIFLAQKNASQLRQLNAELDAQRRQLDWNFDAWKRPAQLNRGRRLSDGPEAEERRESAKVTEPANAGRLQRYVQRIAEVEAERLANLARIEISEAEAKIEFQALIVQFFLQRRFEHVIMATRFYTGFFQDGAGRLEFEEGSDVSRAFGTSLGFNPTVTTLDTFANEAIRDVDQSVESFAHLLERGETDGALRQLQQAFITGEHLPSVQSVERERKARILDYARNAFQLVSAIEVKDFALAEELVAAMREQAADFDYSKPTAAIEAAKLSSNMRIRTARNAALRGDLEEFEENITAAAQTWPTNPELKEQFDLIADSGDVQQQAKLEFDRLLATQSYRQIFNNRARFIAATVDDPERQTALNEIVENITEIETVLQQAETLGRAGNAHAAWEIVERTFQRFPDDVPLSARRSDLSTDVAPFVRALKTAENLERRNQYGSGLAWYLAARRIYPQSEFAEEGIRRLADRILPDQPGSQAADAGAEPSGDDTF